MILRLSKLRESVGSEIADFEDNKDLKQTARRLGFKRIPGDPAGLRSYFSTIQAYRELRASGMDLDEVLALIDADSTR